MVFNSTYRNKVLMALAGVLLVGSVGILVACQVPVFRYALERWTADRYEFVVVPRHDGLTAEESAALEFLNQALESSDVPINLKVQVDEESENSTSEAVARLFYPGRRPGAIESSPIWEGALTMENARRLVDSPARRELAARILRGESSVWVLVESGDKAKDDEAAGVLEEKLDLAQNSLELPEGVIGKDESLSEVDGPIDHENILQSDVPLKIDFSVLRIGRLDLDESIFLTMFLNLEDDLGELSSEPMVFPVFGRGRVLEPLVGRGISEGNILEYSGYLCGACSCEVKDQNPGMDLLMAVNWDAAMAGSEVIIDKILPPLEGTAALIDLSSNESAAMKGSGPKIELESAEINAADSAESGLRSQLKTWSFAVVLVLSIIAIASRLVTRKQS